eukprot:617441-Alexandrium_andersonii.AAC.1
MKSPTRVTDELSARGHHSYQDKTQLKPEKFPRINDIEDLSRLVGAVFFLTCLGQADGGDPDETK